MTIIKQLSPQALRNFALTIGVLFISLLGVLFPWLLGLTLPIWPWLLGIALIIWGLIHPSSLGPVYKIWMALGMVLHTITSPIILGVIFFFLITPIALILRISGKDFMMRNFNSHTESYRIISTKSPKTQMERPY